MPSGQKKKKDDQAPACRVLVAEDDASIRRLLALTLRREGLAVDTARDGVEAVEFLSKRRYRALISDLMMPKMSGWEVVKWLQSHPDERPNSVIITTAADRDVLRDLDPNIVNAIFMKPFNPPDLAVYVNACCQLRAPDRRRSRLVTDTSIRI